MTERRRVSDTQVEQLRAVVRLLRGVLTVLGVLVLYIAALSYLGREKVVQDNREQCVYVVEARVLLANSLRASERANALVAADSRQPPETRAARAVEAAVQRQALTGLDALIDPRYLAFRLGNTTAALNPTGRRIVLDYRREGVAFSCLKVNPDASLLDAIR